MNDAKQRARKFFDLLSDRSLLSSFEGLINGKLLIMEAYICHSQALQHVEGFRKNIGLSQVEYGLTEVQTAAMKLSLFSDLSLQFSSRCLQAADKGDDHYIGITNQTRWPITVFSGIVGDRINELEFKAVVKERTSFVHKSTRDGQGCFFSAGGIFVVGNDEAKSADSVRKGQIISFALSNPFIGCKKKLVL